MKRVLFIDRDGTLIHETADERIDSLEKLRFLPGVITALSDISEKTDYELVMVSNQDGLGRLDYPWERFRTVQNRMMEMLQNEGIRFSDVLLDRHYASEKAPTRKPGTGLFTAYMNADHDLKNSYVIGDRGSDIRLAKHLHAKSIFIGEYHPDADFSTRSWKAIADLLIRPKREAELTRKTRETEIEIGIGLDGSGKADISTGIGFFDHMLELFAKHSGTDCRINVRGDLHVDAHHTIEDTALVLGEAMRKALGDKRGIERYGFLLPMDEALARVALDLSGRPNLVWDVRIGHAMLGEFPSEMLKHFFKSLCDSLGCTLNIQAEGENDHHIAEAVFKAAARSFKQAFRVTSGDLPSTKGIL